MQFKTFVLTALLCVTQSAVAFPKVTPEEFKRIVRQVSSVEPEVRDGQVGRLVQFDPVPDYIGTKKIPGKHDLHSFDP
jgi:(2Fe-2S) ferredoxin